MMTRPLRFCMVTTFYPPHAFGGDGVFVRRLSHALADAGHEVTVIHDVDAYRTLSPEPDPPPAPAHPGVRVVGLSSRWSAASVVLTQQAGRPVLHRRALADHLERGGYDVIHYHNVSLVGGPQVLAMGDAVKFYTLHEYWLVCPTHVLFKNGERACRTPECLRCVLQHRRPPQLWRQTGLLERSVRHVDAFLAPSRFAAAMHAERGLDLPFEHLPHFVPEPVADPAPPESEPDRPYFLFVGRLERLKGLQDVIPTFRDDVGADLLIAGDGAYAPELRALAGGSPHVRFLGRLPYRRLAGLYGGARALIVPSLCYETYGQIAMEAFSYGTPVLARRIGALTEMVEDSGGGLLFVERTQLEDAVARLRDDDDLQTALAARGRAHYEAHGTVERHLDHYLRVVARHLPDPVET